MTTDGGVPIYEALVAELGDPFAGQPARLAARPPVPRRSGATALSAQAVADTDEIPAVTPSKNPTA